MESFSWRNCWAMVVLFNECDISKQNQVWNKTRNYIAESRFRSEKPGMRTKGNRRVRRIHVTMKNQIMQELPARTIYRGIERQVCLKAFDRCWAFVPDVPRTMKSWTVLWRAQRRSITTSFSLIHPTSKMRRSACSSAGG